MFKFSDRNKKTSYKLFVYVILFLLLLYVLGNFIFFHSKYKKFLAHGSDSTNELFFMGIEREVDYLNGLLEKLRNFPTSKVNSLIESSIKNLNEEVNSKKNEDKKVRFDENLIETSRLKISTYKILISDLNSIKQELSKDDTFRDLSSNVSEKIVDCDQKLFESIFELTHYEILLGKVKLNLPDLDLVPSNSEKSTRAGDKSAKWGVSYNIFEKFPCTETLKKVSDWYNKNGYTLDEVYYSNIGFTEKHGFWNKGIKPSQSYIIAIRKDNQFILLNIYYSDDNSCYAEMKVIGSTAKELNEK